MKLNKFGQKTAIWAQLQENLMNLSASAVFFLRLAFGFSITIIQYCTLTDKNARTVLLRRCMLVSIANFDLCLRIKHETVFEREKLMEIDKIMI